MPDLEPVSGDPFATTLTPVNGDPFAVQHAMDAINAQTQARRATMANMFRTTVGAPGTVAQPMVPQTPGMWSDEDEARRLATEGAATDWAPHEALNMIGGGTPAAVEGALGSAGGKGIRAFHGSPHDFEKFDVSKIGTGEGAQAYGHGLYFAESPQVAAQYRKALTQDKINTEGFAKGYPGKTYEVNINADPEHFLDWDKPLSEQPHVPRELIDHIADQLDRDPRGITGADAVHVMSRNADQAAATQQLREAGIPGIKYLDQGSRGKEGGTSNYVVFHHDLVDIVKKYGLAGLVAGGAAHFSTTPHNGNPFAQSEQ